MSQLLIEHLRGDIVESRHRISVAVVDVEGRLVARSGDPQMVTFMRSAAKPFQALPLLQDGAAERFAITPQELALACASHNSERRQVDLIRAWLERIGCQESDLACGPHPALGRDYSLDGGDPADAVPVAPPSPLANNCSGKHTSMLTLARHHGWPIAGYHRPGHPVQQRVRHELAAWCHIKESDLGEATDGCGVVSFALSLADMAAGMARLAASADPAARAVVRAMCHHPDLVAGRGRLCTSLMRAYPGRLVVKVGAEGVYVAGLVESGLGAALKVEDGHGRASMVAIAAVLDQLGLEPTLAETLPDAVALPIRNTRGETVGQIRACGALAHV